MATRIGINGFGRIGRLALRAGWAWPELWGYANRYVELARKVAITS